MKNIILLFLLLIPAFLFAQYPTGTNKSRLGYQTTGDGLIWRGVAADTVLKPRVIAHAYFQLDTVNGILRRYIATNGSWQTVGGGSETDSTIYATRYWTSANFFPLEGGTLTGTGGAGFIGFPSQVSAPGTPASGLNIFASGSAFNWKATDGYERQFASTLTGGRTYTLPDVSGTFALGTGTADRLARWIATNTLAAGNLTDNGTRLQALLPWQFQTYTTAGLPTGVTGYHVYNTTTNGPGWYQGSRWAYGLESTFNRGTATYIPFFDANGQITENARVLYNGTQVILKGTTNYAASSTKSFRVLSNDNIEMFFVNDNGEFGNAGFTVSLGGASFQFASSGFPVLRFPGSYAFLQHQTTTSFNIGGGATNIRVGDYNNWQSTRAFRINTKFEINGNTTANRPSATSGMSVLYHNTDSTFLEYNPNNTGWAGIATRAYARSLASSLPTTITSGHVAYSNGTSLVGSANHFWDNTNGFLGLKTATPLQEIDVNGDAYIRDSTRLTATPAHSAITGLLTRDATGWVGLASLAGGLSYSGGVLTGANGIYSGSDSLSQTNTYAAMASDGSQNFGIGYFPSFPDRTGGSNEYGLYISPIYGEEISLNSGNAYHQIFDDQLFSQTRRNGVATTIFRADASEVDIHMRARNYSGSNGNKIGVDSISAYIGDGGNSFNKIRFPAPSASTNTTPVTGSELKQTIVWTGNGSTVDVAFEYVKKDTTIFVTADTDYDFSAAVTTAQIASRYNRIIIHMTLTSGVGADKTTTLHTPDANLMQCEILIRGTDNTGTYDNEINFGTNNAISSDGTNTSGYTLAQGQGLHVRVVYNGSAYKYIYY